MEIFYDMLVTRCVNRKVLRIETIEKTLLKLTPEIIDAAIDRITAEAQKKPIPNPKEYYKTTLMNAAVENNLLKTTAMPKKDKPSYDIDNFVRLSLKRINGINNE